MEVPITVSTVHEQFSAEDSDITIQSSDGILFKLHRKNLEANTGVFPGPEFDTRGEVVTLSEPSRILEIVFRFVRPSRHPNLKDVDFEKLMEIGEAVEKYEIFSAMNICEVRLSERLPAHAGEIFAYGIQYDYPDLVNKTAYILARTPLLQYVNVFPLQCVASWLQYQQMWQTVLDDATIYIRKLAAHQRHCQPSAICHNCRITLLYWVKILEGVTDISLLNSTVENPVLIRDENSVMCGVCPTTCVYHLPSLKTKLQTGFAGIPPFTDFLKAKDS